MNVASPANNNEAETCAGKDLSSRLRSQVQRMKSTTPIGRVRYAPARFYLMH